MNNISLQDQIVVFKEKLEMLLLDENASPAAVLKASEELDVLITEYYKSKNIVTRM